MHGRFRIIGRRGLWGPSDFTLLFGFQPSFVVLAFVVLLPLASVLLGLVALWRLFQEGAIEPIFIVVLTLGPASVGTYYALSLWSYRLKEKSAARLTVRLAMSAERAYASAMEILTSLSSAFDFQADGTNSTMSVILATEDPLVHERVAVAIKGGTQNAEATIAVHPFGKGRLRESPETRLRHLASMLRGGRDSL